MMKVCGPSIYEPLEIVFNQCLETGVFPSEWKKGNIVPIHKKGDKQTLKNYRPVSLLPICGKILERLMFNEMFQAIPASISNYLLFMRYIVLLMEALKEPSSISQRDLIRCGRMVSFLNYLKMIYQEIY